MSEEQGADTITPERWRKKMKENARKYTGLIQERNYKIRREQF